MLILDSLLLFSHSHKVHILVHQPTLSLDTDDSSDQDVFYVETHVQTAHTSLQIIMPFFAIIHAC